MFKKAYCKLGLKHLLPLLFVVIYTLIGGALFLWIENSHDVEVKRANGQAWLQRRENATARLVHEIINDERKFFVIVPLFYLLLSYFIPA